MASPTPYRDENRRRLRDALVTAARDLTVAHGWSGVTMAAVAKLAGVSRQTVYNEFTDRAGLAEALARQEIEHFVGAVSTRLHEHGGDARAAAHAAVLHTLTEAARNPLIKAVLTSARGGADELLPYLTTRSELVLAAASTAIHDWAAARLTDPDPERLALAAESVVRLTVSHIVQPSAPAERTATALAEVFTRLLG
ncbi:TetR/AcrR family transcriptional regulator [Dactylosporangium matsuzakiense]|uniref:TetR family transcriptional regulator n=1 Tax=Dactylosporangium matsuzakiense TaxID=53360 RepID=A0A9W6NSY6_9ACTN|nr:TetR family transcriptional regulator [Dactylosporangium matsuzakiense]UWZ48330.1 TetR family transcriptional regulator [Dactylosporangium matsuzakiense]GLL07632.1 TetR family transcriptional regulator [Dactylosporangium matsuzakiense]